MPHPGEPDAWAQATDGPGYTCPALTAEGRCGAHDDRPTNCRVWGSSRLTPCPFGCVPAGGHWPAARALGVILKAEMQADAVSPQPPPVEQLGLPATRAEEAVAATRLVRTRIPDPDARAEILAALGLDTAEPKEETAVIVHELPCEREDCRHGPTDHRLDDASNVAPTDPAARFRCLIPGCGCPDFAGRTFDRELPPEPVEIVCIPSAAGLS